MADRESRLRLRATNETDAAFREVARNIERTNKAIGDAAQNIDRNMNRSVRTATMFGSAIGGAIGSAAVQLGNFLSNEARRAIDLGRDHERTMQRLRSQMRLMGVDSEQLRQRLANMGKEFGFSASEMSESLESLVRMNPATAFDNLGHAAKFAASQMAEIKTSSTLVETLIREFKVAQTDIPLALDTIARSAKESGASAEDYAKKLIEGSREFGKFGYSGVRGLQRLGALVGTATRGQTQFNEALKETSAILDKFMDPDAANMGEWAKVNINPYIELQRAIAQGVDPMERLIELLNQATQAYKDMTPGAENADAWNFAEKFLPSGAAARLMGDLRQFRREYNAIKRSIENDSPGEVHRGWIEATKSWTFAVSQLKAQWDSFLVLFGSGALSGPARNLVNDLKLVVAGFEGVVTMLDKIEAFMKRVGATSMADLSNKMGAGALNNWLSQQMPSWFSSGAKPSNPFGALPSPDSFGRNRLPGPAPNLSDGSPGSTREETQRRIEQNTEESKQLLQRMLDDSSLFQRMSFGGGGAGLYGARGAYGGGSGGGGYDGGGYEDGGGGAAGGRRGGMGGGGMESDAGGDVAPFRGGGRNFQTKAPQVMDRLMQDFGLTREQAAGVVGNLGHESEGLQAINERNPLVPGSRGGFGWAQWTGPRRRQFEAWARSRGLDPKSDEANYGFLAHELRTTHKGELARLKQTRTAQEATAVFSGSAASRQGFLRPGIVGMGSRMKWTQRALGAYGNRPTQQAQGATPTPPPRPREGAGAGAGVNLDGLPPTPPPSGIAPDASSVRQELERPINIKFDVDEFPRIRERGASQARREMEREMRSARYLGFSDVGVA